MSAKTKIWLDGVAADIYRRSGGPGNPRDTQAWIVSQLGLVYQEGICDGLAQADEAVKAAFAKQEAKP